MRARDFIDLMGPAAQASAKVISVPKSFTVAETALESGWGASQLASQSKNLFGVKADTSWHGYALEISLCVIYVTYCYIPMEVCVMTQPANAGYGSGKFRVTAIIAIQFSMTSTRNESAAGRTIADTTGAASPLAVVACRREID